MSPRGQIGLPPKRAYVQAGCLWHFAAIGGCLAWAWWGLLFAASTFHWHLRLP